MAEPRITATTRLAAVIGSPVRHSRSPLLANAAFRSADADWVFLALEVAPGDGAAAVDAARTLGIDGLMVTMPHKDTVIPALDDLTPSARALGAVNSIFRDGDLLVGDNTDGAGLVASLRADGIDPRGLTCAVLGAGGAARSIVWALAEAGVARIEIVNRSRERAEIAAALAPGVATVGDPSAVPAVQLVVNATSVGMGADPDDPTAVPVDPARLRAHQTVVDIVYQPLETALLRAARKAGARPLDGLGMLVHQAAISIERWIGRPPDLAAMTAAARS